VPIIFYSALMCDLCNRFCEVGTEHLSLCYIKFVLKGLKAWKFCWNRLCLRYY